GRRPGPRATACPRPRSWNRCLSSRSRACTRRSPNAWTPRVTASGPAPSSWPWKGCSWCAGCRRRAATGRPFMGDRRTASLRAVGDQPSQIESDRRTASLRAVGDQPSQIESDRRTASMRAVGDQQTDRDRWRRRAGPAAADLPLTLAEQSGRGGFMARAPRSYYGRFTGGPDPLAPPVDLAEALDAVSESVMDGYSADSALREFLRRGGRDQDGLDQLAGRIHRRRRDLLSRHRLDGTLQEVDRLLRQAV